MIAKGLTVSEGFIQDIFWHPLWTLLLLYKSNLILKLQEHVGDQKMMESRRGEKGRVTFDYE